MTKTSTLGQSLNRAAGRQATQKDKIISDQPTQDTPPSSVLVGAHFTPEVRRVLKLIEADTGKNLKQLLGEAVNMLAAHYGKPEPWEGEK